MANDVTSASLNKLPERWTVSVAEQQGSGERLILIQMETVNGTHLSVFSPEEARTIGEHLSGAAKAPHIIRARSFNTRDL